MNGIFFVGLWLAVLTAVPPVAAEENATRPLVEQACQAADAGDLEQVRQIVGILQERGPQDARGTVEGLKEIYKKLYTFEATLAEVLLCQEIVGAMAALAPHADLAALHGLGVVPHLLQCPPDICSAMPEEDWRAYRRRSAIIILRLQRYLQDQKAAIPEDIGMVFRSVHPPRGMAQIPPEDVEDPEERKLYEAALAENRRRLDLQSRASYVTYLYDLSLKRMGDFALDRLYAMRAPDSGELQALKQEILRPLPPPEPGSWRACGQPWQEDVEAARAALKAGNLPEVRRLVSQMEDRRGQDPRCFVQGVREILRSEEVRLNFSLQEKDLSLFILDVAERLVDLAPELGFDAMREVKDILPALGAGEGLKPMPEEEWITYRSRTEKVLLALVRYFQETDGLTPFALREEVRLEYLPPRDISLYDPLLDSYTQKWKRLAADMNVDTAKGLAMRKMYFRHKEWGDFLSWVDTVLRNLYSLRGPDPAGLERMLNLRKEYAGEAAAPSGNQGLPSR